MLRISPVVASSALLTAIAIAACSPASPEAPIPSDSGTGGTGAGTSGSTSTGGTGNFAGTFSTGGTVGKGGTTGTGGTTPTGGTAGAGVSGATAAGGASGSAGTATTAGGTAGTGTAGTTATTGGTAGTGTAGTGTAGTGTAGTAGTGPAVTCDAAWSVGMDGFVRAPAGTACWHGYAFAGADPTSTAMPTSFATCGAACMLRFSGSVAASATFSGTAYLGFNVAQSAAGMPSTVTPAGSSLTVTFTNTGASPLRVQIQGATGDMVATDRWCYTVTTSPAVIPYAMFNTQCWVGGAGTAYAKQPIKAIQLVIPGSDMAAVPYDVTLVSVTES